MLGWDDNSAHTHLVGYKQKKKEKKKKKKRNICILCLIHAVIKTSQFPRLNMLSR